jgi:hypothetical protein
MRLLILLLLFTSCSLDRRISKAVKRLGAKDVATHIAIEYPEYLRADTVEVEVVRNVTVEVKVPEIIFDTVVQTNCDFSYTDRFIWLDIEKGNLKYEIKKRNVTAPVSVTVSEKVPCPPCPTVDVVQNAKHYYEAMELKLLERKSFYKKGFFSLLLLVICYIAFRLFGSYIRNLLPLK